MSDLAPFLAILAFVVALTAMILYALAQTAPLDDDDD
jgi:hypothetical protein